MLKNVTRIIIYLKIICLFKRFPIGHNFGGGERPLHPLCTDHHWMLALLYRNQACFVQPLLAQYNKIESRCQQGVCSADMKSCHMTLAVPTMLIFWIGVSHPVPSMVSQCPHILWLLAAHLADVSCKCAFELQSVHENMCLVVKMH